MPDAEVFRSFIAPSTPLELLHPGTSAGDYGAEVEDTGSQIPPDGFTASAAASGGRTQPMPPTPLLQGGRSHFSESALRFAEASNPIRAAAENFADGKLTQSPDLTDPWNGGTSAAAPQSEKSSVFSSNPEKMAGQDAVATSKPPASVSTVPAATNRLSEPISASFVPSFPAKDENGSSTGLAIGIHTDASTEAGIQKPSSPAAGTRSEKPSGVRTYHGTRSSHAAASVAAELKAAPQRSPEGAANSSALGDQRAPAPAAAALPVAAGQWPGKGSPETSTMSVATSPGPRSCRAPSSTSSLSLAVGQAGRTPEREPAFAIDSAIPREARQWHVAGSAQGVLLKHTASTSDIPPMKAAAQTLVAFPAVGLRASAPAPLHLAAAQSGSRTLPPSREIAAGAVFERMDSAPPPRVLASTTQRLSVGVQDTSLGWVEVHARSEGGQIAATVSTASGPSHAAVAAQLPAMRDFLDGQRVRLDTLRAQQSPTSSDQEHNSSGSSRQDSARSGSSQGSRPESRPSFQEEALSWIDVRV